MSDNLHNLTCGSLRVLVPMPLLLCTDKTFNSSVLRPVFFPDTLLSTHEHSMCEYMHREMRSWTIYYYVQQPHLDGVMVS